MTLNIENINKHHCSINKFRNNSVGYGPAITHCFEDTEGNLWVSNDEYSSIVNFCPYCGYEAPKQMEDK